MYLSSAPPCAPSGARRNGRAYVRMRPCPPPHRKPSPLNGAGVSLRAVDSSERAASASASVEQRSNGVECLRVQGLANLGGKARVSGAKNATLPIMAATLLCPHPLVLTNVPALRDVVNMSRVLESCGANVPPLSSAGELHVNCSNLTHASPAAEAVARLRASFFVLGSLVARFGEAKVPLPGGCNIGARPVDIHLQGLRALGVDVHVDVEEGYVACKAVSRDGLLQGARFTLDFPSVGATETLMMAAVLAEGETVLSNCAKEPEIEDLAGFLNSMGCKVSGAGTDTIVISGVSFKSLHAPTLGGTYAIIPDRIEAGTYLAAGAITQSELLVGPIVPRHLHHVLRALERCGCSFIEDHNCLVIRPGPMKLTTDIVTEPFPGFPTDMQAQMCALLATAEGKGSVTETVFENRLQHVDELRRMGAQIDVEKNVATIHGLGKKNLVGTHVMSTDLRAGAALLIAGLSAEGETHVHGLHHLDRGYEHIEDKFLAMGAKIERVQVTPPPYIEGAL